jgi:hypothetical protein
VPDNHQIEEFNKEVIQWGFRTRNLLKSSIAGLSMKGKGDLMRQLQVKNKKDYGEIDRVIFNFPRHGVFFHKGVGRGYIVVAGRVIRGKRNNPSKHGSNTMDNTIQHAATGPLKRFAKPWFTPVFEREIPRLADIITRLKADSILEQNTFRLRT